MTIPKALQPLYDAWMKFSYVLGRVMSFLLLTVFWIIVLGPYAIVWKIGAFLKTSNGVDTYWKDAELSDVSSMKRQF